MLVHTLPGVIIAVTTMTGREFNRHVSKAKRQARHGPVVITSHADVDFEPPRLQEVMLNPWEGE